jgi:hypothetical protein
VKKPLPKLTVVTHPLSMMAGALGAATLGAFRYDQLEKRKRASPLEAAPAG